MKHEKEINEILRQLIYQNWMSDSDYEEALTLIGVSKQELSDAIEVGVKKGHTVESQISLLKKFLPFTPSASS